MATYVVQIEWQSEAIDVPTLRKSLSQFRPDVVQGDGMTTLVMTPEHSGNVWSMFQRARGMIIEGAKPPGESRTVPVHRVEVMEYDAWIAHYGTND